jgi:hypothetical protein
MVVVLCLVCLIQSVARKLMKIVPFFVVRVYVERIGCNGMSCEPALLTIVKQATLVREYLALDTSKTKRVHKVLLITIVFLNTLQTS